MRLFRVWAPTAHSVQLHLNDDIHPLTRNGGGWWWVRATANQGDRYGYSIDDNPQVLPDPRSPRQPDGVHARSAVHDVDPTQWSDHNWTGRPLPGSVLYELHIGTFTQEGTFDAAIDRLDHLVDLGITTVEIMPVNAFDGTHNWGYDGVGWYAVTENYGGPDGLQRFVNACHLRGLAVCLDVVYNHLGPSGNYLPRFGPYLADDRNTWGQRLNLDGPGSDAVRKHIIDNALRWFADFHIDALRIDAIHALVDHRATHVLAELSRETETLATHLNRPLTLIAESDLNDTRVVTPRAAGGLGLTAQWNDDLHHAVHTAISGERQGYYSDFGSLACLARTLTHGFFHAATYSSFRGRTHGAPIRRDLVPASALIGYTCTHDQVGNRATGDRPSAYLSPGQLASKAALVLLSAQTPMLFMGEEWGATSPFQFFTSHTDPAIGDATREGRRAEFADHGWTADEVPDPQDPATFLRSKLDWTELAADPHARLLACYRGLLTLRRSRPEFTDPWLTNVWCDYDETQRWFVLRRGHVAVVVNLSEDEVVVPIRGRVLLAWSPATETVAGTLFSPHSFAVLDEH
ncbi:malto-oligosyltrehalose trehalohydrolase [Nocardia camponoti]|uniref:Malto-oligosyltrehalose trehalohydrolase n=1 Tax=Nocardia camponoti TaxID=1616106 RepID=A0A917QRV3_9NOCA|nr:malto-oligosyltrehalose trehalohydrolase [Nocardia camponoti]GGK65531.1 malto-oligosyltrehalose trehalohydrolase [Nocardia camponoti]